MEAVLPGEDLIEQGLADLREGKETAPALLVCIGASRLRRLGLFLPDNLPANPEHRLYDFLARTVKTLHTRVTILRIEN